MRYLIILLFLFSCSRQTEDPLVAQTRLRALQTRTFVGATGKTVLKEAIGVLQDEGFMIKNASNEMGLVTAERDTQIEKFSSKFWAYVFSGKRASWKKHSLLEMTANAIEDQGKTRLRINFLLRVFDNHGHVVDVHQILEEEVYRDFFNKVQKGILSNQG